MSDKRSKQERVDPRLAKMAEERARNLNIGRKEAYSNIYTAVKIAYPKFERTEMHELRKNKKKERYTGFEMRI